MNAILFHHAGGDKYAFRKVQQWLLPEVKSIAVELPGRSDRYTEPLLHTIRSAAEDIYQQVLPHLNAPFFFVGNSMGSVFAFLLTLRLEAEYKPLPQHIFLASRLSPDAYQNEPNCIGIPSEDFWKVVQQYDGVPPQLLEHKELKEFYEPVLRADFEILQQYNESFETIQPISVPVSILFGKTDTKNITAEKAKGWRKFTTSDFDCTAFEGGHFFLYENENVAEFIKQKVIFRKF